MNKMTQREKEYKHKIFFFNVLPQENGDLKKVWNAEKLPWKPKTASKNLLFKVQFTQVKARLRME